MSPTRLLLLGLCLSFLVSSLVMGSRSMPNTHQTGFRETGSVAANRAGGDSFGGTRMKMASRGAPEAAMMMASAPSDAMPQMAFDAGGSEGAFAAKGMDFGGGGSPPGLGGIITDMLAGGGATGTDDPTVLKGPVILRDGNMAAELLDIQPALQELEREVTLAGGSIVSSNTWADQYTLAQWKGRTGVVPPEVGPTSANVQVQIPSLKFDAVMTAIRVQVEGAGGRVTSTSSSSRDASSEYVDAVTRQRVEEKSLGQMESLLKAAQTVEQVLSVKREMDSITYRLEAAKGRRKFLEGRAQFSTLSISYSVPYPVAAPPPPPRGWSIAAVFSSAFASLASFGATMVELVVYTLVFSLPITLALIVVVKGGALVWAKFGDRIGSAAGGGMREVRRGWQAVSTTAEATSAGQ